ncbi:hypothetical protein E4T56_gene17524, partial [Termitomyces sp. T112]
MIGPNVARRHHVGGHDGCPGLLHRTHDLAPDPAPRAAAIDHQFGPGDIAGVGAGQKHRRPGQFGWFGKATNRGYRLHRGHEVLRLLGKPLVHPALESGVEQRRFDKAGVERIGADRHAPGGKFNRNALGEQAHRALAGIIGRDFGIADQPHDRADIDDAGPACDISPALRHQRHQRPRAKEHPVDIDRPDPPPRLKAQRVNRARQVDPGIVDQNMRRAIGGAHMFGDALPGCLIGNIGAHIGRRPAQTGHGRADRL